jgi:hypothetical protein
MSPTAVLQSLVAAHATGQSSVAVQMGLARVVQHLGVPPEHSASMVHCVRHSSAGAQTVDDEAGLVAQQTWPAAVLQLASLVQKSGIGVSRGTQALADPKFAQRGWAEGQSVSVTHGLGQLVVQTPPPEPLPDPLELHAIASATPARTIHPRRTIVMKASFACAASGLRAGDAYLAKAPSASVPSCGACPKRA